MAQQNKIVQIEDDFIPDDEDDFQSDDPIEQPEEKSLWGKLNTPLIDFPSKAAHSAADIIDKPSLNRSPKRAMLEGFAAGATEGMGDLISDTTSPISLLTGSVLGKIKPITRGIGKGAEWTGRMLSEHKPLTAWMPRIAEPRMFRGMQELGGKGMQYIGNKMKSVGMNNVPKEGDDLLKSIKVIRNETPETTIKAKPLVRLNRDGTYTKMDTGEVVNSKGESIIEINGKPVDKSIDKNSSFFLKNRQ